MKANLPLAIEEINPSGIRRKLHAVPSRIKLGSKSIDIEARPERRVICDLTKRATDYDTFASGIYCDLPKLVCDLFGLQLLSQVLVRLDIAKLSNQWIKNVSVIVNVVEEPLIVESITRKS
jgi:hypothetical protein